MTKALRGGFTYSLWNHFFSVILIQIWISLLEVDTS